MKEQRATAAAWVVVLAAVAANSAFADTLPQELYKLEAMRHGSKTNFDAVEDAGSALLKSHPAPADQGLIHYRLAHIYAQTGLIWPDRVLAHAEAALSNPLPDNERLRLRVYCGDAVQVTRTPFVERRPEAARHYLEGLKEIDTRKLPLEAPDPGQPPGRIDTPDVDEREAHAAAVEKWNAASERSKYAKEIAFHKKVMMRQVSELYVRPPLAIGELEKLTLEYLGESPTRDELLAQIAVQLGIAEAVKRAKELWPGRAVEVECERADQVEEAVAAGADIVMLDNMTTDEVAACVKLVRASSRPDTALEVSGGISLETVTAYAATGADLISTSAITQSAPALDIALDVTEQPNVPKGGGRYPAAE